MTWHFPVDWKQWATRALKKKARTNQWVWEIISESGKLEDPNNSLWVLLCYVAQDEFTPCFDLTINLLTFVAIACGLDSTKKVLKKKFYKIKQTIFYFPSIYSFFSFLSEFLWGNHTARSWMTELLHTISSAEEFSKRQEMVTYYSYGYSSSSVTFQKRVIMLGGNRSGEKWSLDIIWIFYLYN